ncbi:hypothetical protein EAS64_19840 [Trebonia kvetii]|uniref:Uncharacterized protein n=1 Tax=Trebonia kvetii TaxID=2480626 RepID=A0A6P2BZQ7_9ACTN|nr:hypothetical protein [Trebonia kvetii]TVZ04602.1 hypothetical protein EAS64_19840 [Trebonia kvetii]
MSEVTLIAGEADPSLRERLDQENNAVNAAATGHPDARLLPIAARGDSGDLDGGRYGWTWGGCGRTPGHPNEWRLPRVATANARAELGCGCGCR